MNLLYCGNEGVFDGVLTSALSVVRRLTEQRPITVYLFTMELTRLSPNYTPLTQRHAAWIEEALRRHNTKTQVVLHDVTALYETHLRENANESCYCSPYTLLRLLADLLPMPDKLLYLDADVMLNKDAGLLYDIDVSSVEYAAARDHYGRFLIQPNYINAGVLLFNMKKCRETRIFEKSREILRRKKLPFADQSALIRSTTCRKVLPHSFNDQKFLYKSTVVRHFSKRLFYLPYPHTENVKQWHVQRVHEKFGYTCFDDVLDEYIKLKESYQNESV
ncbi:MAG: glycosyltransferase [Firmicutes bacterium]|nr:glycosyltransferase [Bacillota bacterium]